jgi:hypothetical protein
MCFAVNERSQNQSIRMENVTSCDVRQPFLPSYMKFGFEIVETTKEYGNFISMEEARFKLDTYTMKMMI